MADVETAAESVCVENIYIAYRQLTYMTVMDCTK